MDTVKTIDGLTKFGFKTQGKMTDAGNAILQVKIAPFEGSPIMIDYMKIGADDLAVATSMVVSLHDEDLAKINHLMEAAVYDNQTINSFVGVIQESATTLPNLQIGFPFLPFPVYFPDTIIALLTDVAQNETLTIFLRGGVYGKFLPAITAVSANTTITTTYKKSMG